MSSESNRGLMAIVAAGALAVAVGPPPFEGSPARSGGITQGFGSFAVDEPAIPTVHVSDTPTADSARTWRRLQNPIPMEFPRETPLATVLKQIKDATREQDGTSLQIYVDPVGLRESEHKLNSTVTIDLKDVPLATTLDLLLKQVGLMYLVRPDGLVVITCESSDDGPFEASEKILDDLASLRRELAILRREVGEHRTRDHKPVGEKPGPAGRQAKQAPPDPNAEPDLLNQPVSTARIRTRMTAAAAETWTRLQKRVPVRFPDETPLATVIAFVKQATQADGRGPIPIYVDPVGLQEAEATLNSPIVLELHDMPLATTLDLMLRQRGLRYHVLDDGLLMITCVTTDHPPGDQSATILDQISAIRMEVAAMRRWSDYIGRTRRMTGAPAMGVIKD